MFLFFFFFNFCLRRVAGFGKRVYAFEEDSAETRQRNDGRRSYGGQRNLHNIPFATCVSHWTKTAKERIVLALINCLVPHGQTGSDLQRKK